MSDAVLADTALAIIETDGPEQLTIGTLAAALGIKPPSLYNHITGIEDVRMHVRIIAVTRLGDALIEAAMGRARETALVTLCHAYRDFALDNPELYAMSMEPVAGESDDLDRAAWRALSPLFSVLAGFDLDDDEAVHTARAIRSGLHGFVSLENAGGFGLPESVEDSFGHLVDWLVGRVLDQTNE
ncbi:MAG: TetR-like C-terminal domain-containing protein [Hyphomicrobiales bacterium]